MSPPPSASVGSAPEGAGAAAPFLQRRGLLSQGNKAWGEAVCLDVGEGRLYLAPMRETGSFGLDLAGSATFRIAEPSGLLSVGGILAGTHPITVNGVAHRALRLDFLPGGVERRNRRETFRVSVHLKGELVPLPTAPQAATPRPCLVRDLSLGGARLAVASPAPAPGSQALLHVALGPEEAVRSLTCTVLQARPGTFGSPLDALVRVRFVDLPAPAEGRLGRFIARVQLEDLKKGIRGP